MFAISSLKLLLQKGYSVDLACIKNSPIDEASRNMPLARIFFRNSSRGFHNLYAFTKSLRSKRYDIIHTHFSKDLSLIVPALKILGLRTPVVLTKHLGSSVIKKDLFHNFLYNRLNSSIAISEVIRKNLIDTTSLDNSRVTVIHNFIDLDKYSKRPASQALRYELNIDPSCLVLGVIGRLTPGKGHEDIIEAVRILDKEKPNIRIIVAGAASKDESGYETELKGLVNEYKLSGYFIFTGFRRDIPELLSIFDIFLFPSHAEAFGLALLEAMASGVASVVNFSEGVKDIAVKNVTSLTYGDSPSPSMADQIRRLIKDKNLRDRLSANSTDRAKDFSPEIYQSKIDRLYSNLVNSRPANADDNESKVYSIPA